VTDGSKLRSTSIGKSLYTAIPMPVFLSGQIDRLVIYRSIGQPDHCFQSRPWHRPAQSQAISDQTARLGTLSNGLSSVRYRKSFSVAHMRAYLGEFEKYTAGSGSRSEEVTPKAWSNFPYLLILVKSLNVQL